ncbi:MAG: heparan-alpha-glucosaminide N-acetyltransferase domain-containing protein [Christensenellales bacterium]|jgi:uncharacterized membrane protein|nr:DUF1624 domain-containing protein [Clostridiales bacterium]
MKKIKKARIWEADFFRGLAILLVVWDHTMVDLAMFYPVWKEAGVSWLIEWGEFGFEYLSSFARYFWQPVFLFVFFTISGLSTAFSKNNFLRGIKLAAVALLVSVVTYLLEFYTGDQYFILFGVLHCISANILIYSLVAFLIDFFVRIMSKLLKSPYNRRLSQIITAFACLALSAVFYWIHHKFNVSFYEDYYLTTDSKILGMFFYAQNWATADYFPLFPFISFFFLGAGLSCFLYPQKKSLLPSLDGGWHKAVTFAGRYSLIIYLALQVVLFSAFALITYCAAGVFLL